MAAKGKWASGKLLAIKVFTGQDAKADAQGTVKSIHNMNPKSSAKTFKRIVKAGRAEAEVWMLVVREKING